MRRKWQELNLLIQRYNQLCKQYASTHFIIPILRILLIYYTYHLCCSNRLEKENEEKMTKLKDEALGKLKDLGNSILGNFGMSLDNFKMTQDPTSGGWNISMQK